jgi:hypothetical protein
VPHNIANTFDLVLEDVGDARDAVEDVQPLNLDNRGDLRRDTTPNLDHLMPDATLDFQALLVATPRRGPEIQFISRITHIR